jgi:hypothetical protein
MAHDDLKEMLELVPDPYVRGVGLVITQWAWIEACIDQLIWRLLGVRAQRGRIVTSNLLAQAKIEMVAALMRKSRMDEKLIREIEGKGKALATARNLIAHGYISVRPLSKQWGIAHSYLARGGKLTDRRRTVTPEALENVALKISEFLVFILAHSERFPKQRGLRPRPNALAAKPRRLRFETIVGRLPPLLQVEWELGSSAAEQEVARAAKKARKAAHRQRSLDGEK